jgi:Uma2 family endonuclease
MGSMTTLSRADGFTRADLDAMPDDGRRHELIDGVIVVTPSPVTRHQDIVLSLGTLLREVSPQELKVMVAPFDVALSERTVIEPDILVARRSDLTLKDLPTAPVLAVEVLSPSTRWIDRGRKMEILAEAGCSSYWLIDPGVAPQVPTLTAYELVDGDYRELAVVTGTEPFDAKLPFPVTVVPNDLLDD